MSASIASVEILWSENGAIHARAGTYPSLRAAEDAIGHALREEAPPQGGCYDKTEFRVTSDDGNTYEGRFDITENFWRTTEDGRLLTRWIRQFCEYLRDSKRSRITDADREEARYWLRILDGGA